MNFLPSTDSNRHLCKQRSRLSYSGIYFQRFHAKILFLIFVQLFKFCSGAKKRIADGFCALSGLLRNTARRLSVRIKHQHLIFIIRKHSRKLFQKGFGIFIRNNPRKRIGKRSGSPLIRNKLRRTSEFSEERYQCIPYTGLRIKPERDIRLIGIVTAAL